MSQRVPHRLAALLTATLATLGALGRGVPGEGQTAAALRPRRVLLDMSHEFAYEAGNALCGNDGYLRPRGYLVFDTEAGLRADIIRAFDALVLFNRGSPARYTPEDVAVVKSLLDRGGGVLLYADAGEWPSAEEFPLNSIARELGVEFLPERAREPVRSRVSNLGEPLRLNARRLRVLGDKDYSVLVEDAKGDPVGVCWECGPGRVAAVSGSDLLTNPASREPPRNPRFTATLLDWLASASVADAAVKVERLARTWSTRIDPDRSIETPGFRILYPDPLPEERARFLREQLPTGYSLVTGEFGYEVTRTKTVIALMCCGSGWTASSTLVGVGVLGDEIPVISVMIHELSNSLCVETPLWLGDAGWSGYMQVKVKKALGGRFAESVQDTVQRTVADYREWERTHGLYDLTTEKDHHVGQGKVWAILSEFDRRYGSEVMRRYFAAAIRWKDDPRLRGYSAHDRAVFYFSLATGEDQFLFFRQLGTSVRPIPLPR